jgi:hypothetical protein
MGRTGRRGGVVLLLRTKKFCVSCTQHLLDLLHPRLTCADGGYIMGSPSVFVNPNTPTNGNVFAMCIMGPSTIPNAGDTLYAAHRIPQFAHITQYFGLVSLACTLDKDRETVAGRSHICTMWDGQGHQRQVIDGSFGPNWSKKEAMVLGKSGAIVNDNGPPYNCKLRENWTVLYHMLYCTICCIVPYRVPYTVLYHVLLTLYQL